MPAVPASPNTSSWTLISAGSIAPSVLSTGSK
jgi:hypothetical protein